ncbi:hypothetical protein Lepto7375DRAFT_3223 [Leptolyngbya sp. PCC 7375]|nr:hypothetical protein Lepto7375DRAFT_3223 [Leptolyngbya sp. PCC 7375]
MNQGKLGKRIEYELAQNSFDLEHARVKELSRQLGECMEVLRLDLQNFLSSFN